jgi:P27 family predicted phage terminase small subunit
VKTEGGNIIQNPFLAVANKCLLQMAQLESEFGLTPSSRSRIRMAEPADGERGCCAYRWLEGLR